MPISSAEDLFHNELRAIRNAEQQLAALLPDLSRSVRSANVRQRLQDRAKQGQHLLQQVDQMLAQFQVPEEEYRNETVESMLSEAQDLVKAVRNETVLDTALIGAVQKIEHYCIASWGTAAALGRTLGRQPASQAFEQALAQGRQFDKAMTDLAENEVNPAAAKAAPTRH